MRSGILRTGEGFGSVSLTWAADPARLVASGRAPSQP
jgi:hypothetical protein